MYHDQATIPIKTIDFENGVFSVHGTDRQISFAEIADISYHASNLPSDGSVSPGLDETVFYEPQDTNDPQAMHLVVVLVDDTTGSVKIRDYFTSDDCGRIINPMIVDGQLHGGAAQGIAQAQFEEAKYDDNDEIMKWPLSVAPYEVAIIPLISKNDNSNLEKANNIYLSLIHI